MERSKTKNKKGNSKEIGAGKKGTYESFSFEEKRVQAETSGLALGLGV